MGLEEAVIKDCLGNYLNRIFFQQDSHRFSNSYEIFSDFKKKNVGNDDKFFVIFEIDQDEQHDLIPSEKYAIQRFKPIENVLADHSEVIPNDFISEIFQPLNNGTRFFYSHQILLNNHYIFIL